MLPLKKGFENVISNFILINVAKIQILEEFLHVQKIILYQDLFIKIFFLSHHKKIIYFCLSLKYKFIF